jgi:uncharacterized protein involved in exopolysaccharide biosynthesis
MDSDKIFSEQTDNSSTKSTLEGLIDIIEILWKNRKQTIKTVLVVVILAAAISFIWPKTYIAHATILPDLEFLNSISNLGGFKDLAAAIGLNPNQSVTSPSQLYPDIMQSEIVLRRVIFNKYKTEKYDSLVNLIQYWGFDDADENLNFERCIKKLREAVFDISVDKKTLIISLDVATSEPQFSADLANEVAKELDYFQRNFRRTNASEQRKFLEQRMTEVKNDLATSEDKLKEFREKNRRAEQSPQLLLEQDRLGRDVELNTAIFIELKKQYELSKLDEIKNTPIVQILDKARPPAKRDKPKRTLIVLTVFIITLLGSSAWVVIKERFKQKMYKDSDLLRFIETAQKIKADINVFRFNRKS